MVGRDDIDQMANIMSIFNGGSGNLNNTTRNVNGGNNNNHITASIDQAAGVDAMKNILQSFYGASGSSSPKVEAARRNMERVSQRLVDESKYDSTLRSAMITEATDDGSRIGEWNIYLKQEGKRKRYDVINENTGVTIAEDLTLYEAAFGIARSLADGQPITCKIIRAILLAEGEYSQALSDAINFKHTLSKPLNENRKALLEDRYEIAREKAQFAKTRVQDLVKPPF
jgi:hypothetical protein